MAPIVPRAQTPGKLKDYTCLSGFDKARFVKELEAQRATHAEFRAQSSSRLDDTAWYLVSLMQSDPSISDVRWMAYMLATAFHEGGEIVKVKVKRPKLGAHNRPVLDKNKKQILEDQVIGLWDRVVTTTEQPENKQRYKAPVKVKCIDDGDIEILRKGNAHFANLKDGAWVMEKDGDQFVFDRTGRQCWTSKKAVRGATFLSAPVKAYNDFGGDEHTYVGRGYAQITWFDTYVRAGVALNKGLDLLFHPDDVNDRETAYKIMSTGMKNGTIFANGRKFSMYFDAKTTDYVGARAMVNGSNKAHLIAGYAQMFEAALMAAKK